MAEEKRLIGNDGYLAGLTIGTAAQTSAIPARSWVKIQAKAASASKFGGLSVGDFFFNPKTTSLTLTAGDGWYSVTINPMQDLSGWSLDLSGSEVETTALSDTYKKYRKGKLDANGSAEFVFIKGITENSRATLTLSTALITANSTIVTINGTALTPVVFATDAATTMAAIVTAINANATLTAAGVFASYDPLSPLAIQLDGGVTSASAVTTLGATQPSWTTQLPNGLTNYFFNQAVIDATGNVAYSARKTSAMYLVGYLDGTTISGEAALVTILQIEFFDFSLPMTDSTAVKMSPKFRLVGGTNPILYRITNA